MTYLRSLFLNILIVFFVNNVISGIEISAFEFVPNIGKDILFSVIVGFLNASIFPFLVLLDIKISFFIIAILAFFISFLSYGSLLIFNFGIKILNAGAFFSCSIIVWGISVFSNYLEYLHSKNKS